jgi:hypothetical protein
MLSLLLIITSDFSKRHFVRILVRIFVLFTRLMDESVINNYLFRLNTLLSKIKIPISLLCLTECVPSLWIALFEGLLETRIPEVDRSFNLSDESRIKNIQAVLDQLKQLFSIDLEHIKPLDLISYDETAVCNLIDVFVEISESLNDWKNPSSLPQAKAEKENGQKKRKRPIYTGKQLQSIVKDDVSRFVKESNRSSLEAIQEITPVKVKATELLKPEQKDTPHMKALKLKRMNLLKNISDTTDNATKFQKSQKSKEYNLNKLIEMEIKQLSSSAGLVSEIEEMGKHVASKEFKTRPEKNLDVFEERVRKSMPTLEPYPSKKVKDQVHELQLKTWTKALDDRLWNKKVSERSRWEAMSDSRIIEQAQKEIERSRDIVSLRSVIIIGAKEERPEGFENYKG